MISVSKSAITALVQEPTPVQTGTGRDNKLLQLPREPGNARRLPKMRIQKRKTRDIEAICISTSIIQCIRIGQDSRYFYPQTLGSACRRRRVGQLGSGVYSRSHSEGRGRNVALAMLYKEQDPTARWEEGANLPLNKCMSGSNV